MSVFDKEYFNLGYLDMLSCKDTFVHRLDPRVKLIVTLIFILFVVSFSKYEVQGLVPFFIFPAFMLSAGDIPLRFILRKLLIVSPFVLFIGIFNPLLDTAPFYSFNGILINKGWVSYLSIIIKFMLTVSSALLLIATTSFPGICAALEKLKTPRVFVVQLLFLYRYLFVLVEEAMRMVRARNMKSFKKRGMEIKTFINMAGVLFVRTVERSERVYQSMCSRGFDGEIRLIKKYSIGVTDTAFAAVTVLFLILLKMYDITEIIGGMFL